MTGKSGSASAALVGVMLLATPAIIGAQSAAGIHALPVSRIAALAPGAIHGVVRDETGAPLAGATVSALGATTTVAVTDQTGRFELRTLTPGPYLVRAHLTGFVAPRAQMVEVRSSGLTMSSLSLRRAPATLAASVALVSDTAPAAVQTSGTDDEQPAGTTETVDDDHSELAWRIRHARRGVLRQTSLSDTLLANAGPGAISPVDFLGRAVGSPAHLATAFFAETPFSGQVNLLTTGSFDTPQQLFSSDNFARGIAYVRVGAPAGQGDWAVRGAVNQGDISSWLLAGSYTTRSAGRHSYDIGMSYSTQRYDGGNPLALRDVTDGSRNAGEMYGFDRFTITPAIVLRYGGRYARYDYLDNRSLLSPRVELTVMPVEHLRLIAEVSRRAQAPGAEEFLPPADTGIWLPPQRTFSSTRRSGAFQAERATRVALDVERDFGGSTVGFGAFLQQVDDQLVTLFGIDVPGQPSAKLGHYVVGNAGDVSAAGCIASFRTTLASRVSGSIAYTLTNANFTAGDHIRYLVLMAPSTLRPDGDRIQDVSTSIETHVPETDTRVLLLYRVSNGFAQPGGGSVPLDRPGVDARFDVQVRQSLPFMNFTSAKWEMLVAVRNFFGETAPDQSLYDELLVVRPPKRIVGGVTMRF